MKVEFFTGAGSPNEHDTAVRINRGEGIVRDRCMSIGRCIKKRGFLDVGFSNDSQLHAHRSLLLQHAFYFIDDISIGLISFNLFSDALFTGIGEGDTGCSVECSLD